MADARLKEADGCLAKAEKYLKTNLLSLKFKPDLDSAATEYERAAVCLRNAKQSQRCKEVYLKAADCHDKNGNLFHAAKCREQAAYMCRDLNELGEASKLMEAAAQQYGESGTAETSASSLQKAAQFFETIDPEKAISIYERALNMTMNNTRQASEFLSRLTKLNLKLKRLDDAADCITREIDLYVEDGEAPKVGKLTSGLVLVHLARGDTIQAHKSYKASFRCQGFENTEDAPVLGSLIGSFETGDDKTFKSILQRPQLKYLNDEFLRLMKTLEPPKIYKDTEESVEEYAVDDDGDVDLR